MIGWTVTLVALLALHVALPAWWWIMAVPFSWGFARAPTLRRAFVGGAALGASAWGAGVALGSVRGAGIGAGRVATLLAPMTGSSPAALAAWTVGVGAIAAAVASTAGRSCRPWPRRPGSTAS